jgi:type IV pilus assembly protein PilV
MMPNFFRRIDSRAPVKQLRSQRALGGFALLESLIAIAIFSVGVLGLLGLEARAINYSLDAEDRNRAALLASEVASAMWLNGNVTLPAATYTAFQASAADPTKTGLPSGNLTVLATAGTTNSADITITWKAPYRTTGEIGNTLTTRVILP